VDRDELHGRIRRLIFASPAISEAFTRGEFRSVFKGRGMDFEALREYDPGDDARLIDWNVSVRLARPYVRLYREDRSLTLFLLVDLSASMEEGSGELSKADMAVLSASLLAYAAQLRGMPVGALLFGMEGGARYFEPRRGKSHALAIMEAAADASAAPQSKPLSGLQPPAPALSPLPEACDTAFRLLKRRSLVVAASDFFALDFQDSLARLGRRHDLVALRITDSLDLDPPRGGALHLRDSEGHGRTWLPLGSRGLRKAWNERGKAEAARCRAACLSARVPLLEIDTADDPALALLEFFGRRRKP
jgi:uncharacterized protein (DUF58 family)